MSILQISKIQVRTGNVANIPQLAPGEFGFATDTKQLFIGNDPSISGPTPNNTEILTQNSGVGLVVIGRSGNIPINLGSST